MSGVVIDHFGAGWLWATCALLGTVAAAGYWLLMRGLPTGTGATKEPALAQESAATQIAAATGTAPAPEILGAAGTDAPQDIGVRATKAEASPS